MDQDTQTSTTRTEHTLDTSAVLFRVRDQSELEVYAEQLDPLAHIGFTGVTGRGDVFDSAHKATQKLTQSGFTIHSEPESDDVVDLSNAGVSASDLWTSLEARPRFSMGPMLTGSPDKDGARNQATILLQMSTSPVPVVPVSTDLVYSSALREQRELLRSLVFWRKRFDIARHTPKLVHAGDDGLLIFITDSWLITVNQNPEEASIDLGSHGSMWLMLGTQRDVHLHGSMLILPPHSGAIVANELAR